MTSRLGLQLPRLHAPTSNRAEPDAILSGNLLACCAGMIGDELRARSRQFAIDVVMLCVALEEGDVARTIRPQLLRAATGTAANYRAACRARSGRESASRLAVCTEEADEAELWLDILETVGIGPVRDVKTLRNEATQLRAIFARSRATALENAARKRKATMAK